MVDYSFYIGPFSTKFNEYTQEAHQDISKQARRLRWVCISTIENKISEPTHKIKHWCRMNKIYPIFLAHCDEIWFETEEDAILFKLTWC